MDLLSGFEIFRRFLIFFFSHFGNWVRTWKWSNDEEWQNGSLEDEVHCRKFFFCAEKLYCSLDVNYCTDKLSSLIICSRHLNFDLVASSGSNPRQCSYFYFFLYPSLVSRLDRDTFPKGWRISLLSSPRKSEQQQVQKWGILKKPKGKSNGPWILPPLCIKAEVQAGEKGIKQPVKSNKSIPKSKESWILPPLCIKD